MASVLWWHVHWCKGRTIIRHLQQPQQLANVNNPVNSPKKSCFTYIFRDAVSLGYTSKYRRKVSHNFWFMLTLKCHIDTIAWLNSKVCKVFFFFSKLTKLYNPIVVWLHSACVHVSQATLGLVVTRFLQKTEMMHNLYLILQIFDYALCIWPSRMLPHNFHIHSLNSHDLESLFVIFPVSFWPDSLTQCQQALSRSAGHC